jgi:hypothetical protein
MDQRREQNVDVSRTHQDPELLKNRFLVGKVGTHVGARRREDEEKDDAEYEVYPLHELSRIVPRIRHGCTGRPGLVFRR